MRNKNSTGVVPPTRETSRMSSPLLPSSSAYDQRELERTPSELVSLPHHHLLHHEPGIEIEIEAVPGPEAIRCAERDVHKLQELLHDTCAQALTVARGLSYCTSTRAAAQLWPAQRETEEQEKKINELQVKLKAAYAEVASQGRLVANAKQKSLECERREEDTRTRLELAERDGAALRELCEKHLREKEGVLKDNADLRAKYAKLTEKYGRVKGKAIEYKRRLTLAERKEDEEGDRANTLEMQKFSAKIKEEEEEEDKTSPGSLVEDEKNGDKKKRQIPSEFASGAGGIGGTGGAGGASRVKKKTETEREREVDPLRSPFDVAFSLSDQEEEEEEDDCNGEAEVRSSQETPTRKRPQHCQSTFRSTAAVYNNTTPGSAAAAAAATTKDSPGWIPRKLPVKEGTPRTKMRQVRLFNEDIGKSISS